MSRGKKNPEKKKHPAKPRTPPVVPLSIEERQAKARDEFQKGVDHLAEAERMVLLKGLPLACMHSAYYAMYHCACAALLAAGGVGKRKDAPANHEDVIQHFGRLVANEGDDLQSFGLILNRARTDRVVADYTLNTRVTEGEAASTTLQARNFVDAVSTRWPAG